MRFACLLFAVLAVFPQAQAGASYNDYTWGGGVVATCDGVAGERGAACFALSSSAAGMDIRVFLDDAVGNFTRFRAVFLDGVDGVVLTTPSYCGLARITVPSGAARVRVEPLAPTFEDVQRARSDGCAPPTRGTVVMYFV